MRGTTIYLAGPLALAAILFGLGYEAGQNGSGLSGTYNELGEIMIVLWFFIVIANIATRRRWR